MAISVRCPSCSKRLAAKDSQAGMRIACPGCGKKLLVPEPEDLDEEVDEEEETPAPRRRKVVYLQQGEPSGVDVAGTISLVLGLIALVCLAMGWFTHGWTYYGAVAVSLIGLGLAFLGRGNLRIADWALNSLVLLPGAIVLGLFLAGFPVVMKTPTPKPPVAVAEPKYDGGPGGPMQEIKWTDASKGTIVPHGNVLVKVNAVRIDVPKSTELDKFVDSALPGLGSKQVSLLIEVQVGNPLDTKKLEFKPWSKNVLGEAARLTDNFKNSYKPRAQDGLAFGGINASESINPNTTISDTLSFELPIEKMKYLHLELPAENFGGTGKVYFEIPSKMIVKAAGS